LKDIFLFLNVQDSVQALLKSLNSIHFLSIHSVESAQISILSSNHPIMSFEQLGDDSRGRRKSMVKIPRLKGRSNYLEWAQAVEVHLKAEQCWGIVTGELQRPTQPQYNPYTKPISAIELQAAEPGPVLSATAAAQRLTVIDAEIKRWEAWEGKHQYAIEQVFKTVERSIWDCLAH
jgi:hypothetical protein